MTPPVRCTCNMQLSLPIVIIYIHFPLLGENITGRTRIKRKTEIGMRAAAELTGSISQRFPGDT